jgi:hypothetical protein
MIHVFLCLPTVKKKKGGAKRCVWESVCAERGRRTRLELARERWWRIRRVVKSLIRISRRALDKNGARKPIACTTQTNRHRARWNKRANSKEKTPPPPKKKRGGRHPHRPPQRTSRRPPSSPARAPSPSGAFSTCAPRAVKSRARRRRGSTYTRAWPGQTGQRKETSIQLKAAAGRGSSAPHPSN